MSATPKTPTKKSAPAAKQGTAGQVSGKAPRSGVASKSPAAPKQNRAAKSVNAAKASVEGKKSKRDHAPPVSTPIERIVVQLYYSLAALQNNYVPTNPSAARTKCAIDAIKGSLECFKTHNGYLNDLVDEAGHPVDYFKWAADEASMQREKRKTDAAQRAEANKAKRANGTHAAAAMDEEYPDYDDEAPLLG